MSMFVDNEDSKQNEMSGQVDVTPRGDDEKADESKNNASLGSAGRVDNDSPDIDWDVIEKTFERRELDGNYLAICDNKCSNQKIGI